MIDVARAANCNAASSESLSEWRDAARAARSISFDTMRQQVSLRGILATLELVGFRRDLLFAPANWSMYDLINVVTARAREIDDPALRWELEAIGGGLAEYVALAESQASHVTP